MVQAPQIHDVLTRHWAGQLLTAASLPGWALLIAASVHAPQPLASFCKSLLVGVAILAGLLVIGLWLWSRDRPGSLERQIKAWTRPLQNRAPDTSFWSLLGGAAFFASVLQVVMDFNIFSRLLDDLGVGPVSAWGTLLTLSAIQLICFFAHNRRLKPA
ncbi:hypothetical protein [Brevundimonas sp.]|uniref:hypothetical protein n=1 Tax=Brevundimonas sp. TaxID=1871086 RepID=UPI00289B371A|nr:hypothetical protein [Brevundimonas sp.]